MIAGQTKHILDAQAGGPQQIGLDGNTIPVTGDHLEDRFGPGLMAAADAATDEMPTPWELSARLTTTGLPPKAFKAASATAPAAVAPGAHSAAP